MSRFPFIGPSYTLASVAADCQQLMNFLLEVDETKGGRSPVYIKRTPGLLTFCDLSSAGTPIRGMLAGENRLFAVAGGAFCEIFADGTFNNRGNVGNDGLPVSILANGNQVLIVSAGHVYCDSGLGPVIATFNPGSGTVDTNGMNVTWDSGSEFFELAAGQQIVINSVVYVIAALDPDNPDTALTLTTSAGVQSNVSWSGFGLNGKVNTFGLGEVLSTAGSDPFPANLAGGTITIAGTPYTVTSVSGPNKLFASGVPSGLRGVPYGADVPVSAFMGTYIDSYFVVAQPASRNFYISAPFDGTTWDASDTAQKEGYPDNISAIRADHEQLWILGDEESGEVWLDTGAALFPFQRSASQTIHYGCVASWSLVRFGNGISWLAIDEERGGPYAFYAEGSGPNRISTVAVEQAWASYSVVYDAVSYPTVEDGHEILVINFPTANATWCYDRTATAQLGIPCWHQRGWWNGSSNDRQRPSFHSSVVLQVHGAPPVGPLPFQAYVGDWQSGRIYLARQDLYSDAGVAIHRVRTSQHGAGADNLRTFFERFELLIDLGPGATNVQPTLSYSVDGGHTFTNPQTRNPASTSSGVTNPFQRRFLWWRQGASRDRVFMLQMSDQTPFAIIDAYYEASQGTN